MAFLKKVENSLNVTLWPNKLKHLHLSLSKGGITFCQLKTVVRSMRVLSSNSHSQQSLSTCSICWLDRHRRISHRSSLPYRKVNQPVVFCRFFNSEKSDFKNEELNTEKKNLPLIVQLSLQKLENKNLESDKQITDGDEKLSVKDLQRELNDMEWDFKALQKKAEEGMFDSNTNVKIETENALPFSHLSENTSEQKPSLTSLDTSNLNENYNYVEAITLDELDRNQQLGSPEESELLLQGTPDPSVPISRISCPGCGSKHHCQNQSVPGYMPSERFKSLTTKELYVTLCQRCYLLVYHKFCLQLKVSANEYTRIMNDVRRKKALVLLLIDLTDFQNSIITDLMSVIGTRKQLFIIGNKVDLIPRGPPGYLKRIEAQLRTECERTGLNPLGSNIVDVSLVSAKNGYGVEDLISKLMKTWQIKGDVYLIGCTNAGKSTLFNALLRSDYCKSNARDIIHRATVSKWPGTTLNLLKFPIVDPVFWRMKLREQRLTKQKGDKEKELERYRKEEVSMKNLTFIDHIGITDFRSEKNQMIDDKKASGEDLCQFDFTGDSFEETVLSKKTLMRQNLEVVNENDFKDAKFLFDTPGVINQEQIVNLLTQEELFITLPSEMMKPRPYLIKPSEVIFITGLGRMDYIQGDEPAYFIVYSANNLPIHVLPKETADIFYEENLGKESLLIPSGDSERLNKLPALVGREFQMNGCGLNKAVADIQLSSLGWISVSAEKDTRLVVRAYTPGSRGCYLRDPPLLSNVKNLTRQESKRSKI